MEILLLIVLIVLFLYLVAISSWRKHSGLQELRNWSYAHRGLHNDVRPENSMSAFRAALEKGYGIELDVHLMKDGNLAVIHDSDLKRTAGADVCIEDLITEQLADYHLQGTSERIPEFRQVLELFAGKAPLIIELKASGNNHAALCQKTCEMLEGYTGPYCMESFDPRCVLWLKKNRPDIIRGQLAENYFATRNALPWILKFLLTNHLENFLTEPDFIAYKFEDRKNLSNTLVRKLWGVQGVTWTLCCKADYDTALAEGWIPIFENFEP